MSALPVRGRLLRGITRGEHALEYLAYCPGAAQADAPLLVAVHGYARDAAEQAERWGPLCDAAGAVLAAPHFDAGRYRDYQRLGGRGLRADRALDELIAELRQTFDLLLGRTSLFGFSGGGQFVHRYVLAHPKRISTAAIAAPGWFTFPSRDEAYPLGLRGARRRLGVRMRPEAFARVPLLVAVGEHDDDGAAENLRRSLRLDAQQGTNRLERATRWVDAMRQAAREAGCAPRIRFEQIAGAGHSFAECMEGGLGDLVLAHAGIVAPPAECPQKSLIALT